MAGCPALRTRPVALPHVRACARVCVHAHLKRSFPSETRYVYTHTLARARANGVARRDPLPRFDISPPQHPLLQDQHSGGVRASFAGVARPKDEPDQLPDASRIVKIPGCFFRGRKSAERGSS